jgi:GMP synthase (glutamine-hydrolysing)
MTQTDILLIQHADWEGPGRHLLAAASRTNCRLRTWRAWEEAQPAWAAECAAVVALGGPPNVAEEEKYPYLRPLKAYIRAWVSARQPYLGFCLGHQLLAHVLGCEVGPQPRRSIGWTDGRLTPTGRVHPLLKGLPETLRLFKWHGQGVRLPLSRGIDLLMQSPACDVEAVSPAWAPQVVGMQFDLHAASEHDAALWVASDAAWLAQGEPIDGAAIVAEAREREAEAGRVFGLMWDNFLGLVRGGR